MRAARICLAVVILASARPALAAPAGPGPAVSPAEREAARALSKRGYELFEQKDYKGAIEAFRKAEEHIHAPPHWLYIARAQGKLGKLLAAKESYERILTEKLAPDAPTVFKEALTSARSELTDLEPRIPSIYITVNGSAAARAKVVVDGVAIAPTDLGQAIPMDPGLHSVVTTAPGVPQVPQVERAVMVKEGSNVERVSITMDVPSSPSVVPPVLAFTLGGLALGAGGATLGLALTDTTRDAVRVRNLEIASVACFIGGGLGVGLGITLVALRPSQKAPASAAERPRLRARIGPSSIAIEGAF